MAKKAVIGAGLYGMFGPVTDPGERVFSKRVQRELGVDIGASPYGDNQLQAVVDRLLTYDPKKVVILLWASSLGANNITAIAAAMHHYTFHGLWGFQASKYGGHNPVTSNVLFAHLVSNPHAMLGSYEWVKAEGNTVTSLYVTRNSDMHPGDYNPQVQAMFLGEMARVIKAGLAST